MFTKKRKANQLAAALTVKAAARIAKAVGHTQNGFARFMNRKTNQYSAKTWAILIIVFALSWGGLSVYFISSAFTKHSPILKSSPDIFIKRPMHADSLEWMEKNNKK